MFRKDRLVEKGLKYDSNALYIEDYKLWIDCLLSGLKIQCSPFPVLMYRQHSQQITSSKRIKQFSNFLIAAHGYAKLLFDKAGALHEISIFAPLVTNYFTNRSQAELCIELIDSLVTKNNTTKVLEVTMFKAYMERKKQHIEKKMVSLGIQTG
ncbi:MAG: hypothetical protein EOP48_12280 [Sphingobacteriales bacterium]|nr:MAG: hypothetical protein EOP48_12280 [Sphingobacteriales bacterium]